MGTRATAGLVALTLLVPWGPPLHAAQVDGTVAAAQGTLPQGIVVRATSLNGVSPAFAAVGEDGTYQFPDLPPGSYDFEVIDSQGRVMESAAGFVERVTVPEDGTVMVHLEVIVDDDDGGEPVPPPPGGGGNQVLLWSILGGVLGAVAIVAIAGRETKQDPKDPNVTDPMP